MHRSKHGDVSMGDFLPVVGWQRIQNKLVYCYAETNTGE
jgi:hypothetical protein